MALFPAVNIIDWANNAGLNYSIPTSRSNIIDVTDYGATGDGTTDDTTAIQDAIDAATTGDVVYFPGSVSSPVTYKITTQLLVFNKSITLRGVGRSGKIWGSEIKLFGTTETNVIKIYAFSISASGIDISSGYTKGSTALTFADASTISSISAGDIICVSGLNQTDLVYNDGKDSGGTLPAAQTYLGIASGTRTMTQLVKVSSKVGATLNLARPLYFTIQAADSPQVLRYASGSISFSGVEDLKLSRDEDASGYSDANLVRILFGVNCWVKNCDLTRTTGAGVKLMGSYGCVVRDNYIHTPLSRGSGHSYGVWLFGPNSDHLVENNALDNMRHSLIPEGGGSGNIFGYNYCIDDQGSEGDTFGLNGSCDTHGACPYCNLWEGNITQKATHDNTWGNAVYNSWYRNWVTIAGKNIAFTSGLAGVDFQQHSYYNAFVGGIVGKSGQTGARLAEDGWVSSNRRSYRFGFITPGGTVLNDANVSATTTIHRSYDFIGDGFYDLNNGGLDSTLDDSLYHASKPDFFGALSWPPFDPDSPGDAAETNLPAGYFYANDEFPADPPLAPSGLTATATGSSVIDLAWTDNSDDETGFKIERSLNGSTGWTQIGTAAADATSYSDTGLSSGTAYYYRVRAYNTYGNSAYSASANDTTDAAPTVGAGRYVGSGAAAMF